MVQLSVPWATCRSVSRQDTESQTPGTLNAAACQQQFPQGNLPQKLFFLKTKKYKHLSKRNERSHTRLPWIHIVHRNCSHRSAPEFNSNMNWILTSLKMTLSALTGFRDTWEILGLQFDGVSCETGYRFANEGLHLVITDTFQCPPAHTQSARESSVWKWWLLQLLCKSLYVCGSALGT